MCGVPKSLFAHSPFFLSTGQLVLNSRKFFAGSGKFLTTTREICSISKLGLELGDVHLELVLILELGTELRDCVLSRFELVARRRNGTAFCIELFKSL